MSLDQDLIKPTYKDGDCLTRRELNDFFDKKYSKSDASEINSHCVECDACLALANKIIEERHKES